MNGSQDYDCCPIKFSRTSTGLTGVSVTELIHDIFASSLLGGMITIQISAKLEIAKQFNKDLLKVVGTKSSLYHIVHSQGCRPSKCWDRENTDAALADEHYFVYFFRVHFATRQRKEERRLRDKLLTTRSRHWLDWQRLSNRSLRLRISRPRRCQSRDDLRHNIELKKTITAQTRTPNLDFHNKTR
jgi:hypothetical protein